MPTKKSKQRNAGRWTESRYKGFITSSLRAAFRKWPPKFDVLKNAAVCKKINESTGRLATHYRCTKCRELFPQKQIQVDHVQPVVDTKKGFVSWDVFIDRLFCEADNLQLLCKNCHKEKSKKERKHRDKQRKNTGV